jgi:hypothetical protein
LTVGSEREYAAGDMIVDSVTTEFVSPYHFGKRYVQSGLRSSSAHVDPRADDFSQSQEIGQERLVDLALRRW